MVRGIRADVLVKIDYSDVQSYYLARFLGDLRADVPVSLIGYSLGPRRRPGAVGAAPGGSIADRCLPAAAVTQRCAEPSAADAASVLVAAACDAECLLPGHRDGLALALVERMLVTTNPCDRVLRRIRGSTAVADPRPWAASAPIAAPAGRVRPDRTDRPGLLGGPAARLVSLRGGARVGRTIGLVHLLEPSGR